MLVLAQDRRVACNFCRANLDFNISRSPQLCQLGRAPIDFVVCKFRSDLADAFSRWLFPFSLLRVAGRQDSCELGTIERKCTIKLSTNTIQSQPRLLGPSWRNILPHSNTTP